jgi:two-component system response regulator PilR (NtrC family)
MDFSHRALIVDDEQDILSLLERVLAKMGISPFSASSINQAKQLLAKESGRIHFCITDMRLPDGSGIDLVKKISTEFPHIPVAMITAYGSVETAVEALQAGAFDFVSKPIELDVLRRVITNALRQAGYIAEHSSVRRESRLVGNSPAMLELKEKIAKVARSQAPVLIHGESGTGKELVAREIHRLGSRADQPFIAVNCGAIPAELMESEFFGHRKGSFTGAVSDKQGLFEAANGGTLFLDEIAELPLSMQVKLLRAIQERAIKPVGDHQERRVDVRILSATHKNLQKEVEEQRFRMDLYYRLNVISLDIPSLRQRKEDLPLLADVLLQRIAAQTGHSVKQFGLTQTALDKLLQHRFSGNVRELENLLERACTFCENNRISAEDIAFDPLYVEDPQTESERGSENDQLHRQNIPVADERGELLRVLNETHWNRTEAAKKLGMTLRQIRYRIDKYELDKQ